MNLKEIKKIVGGLQRHLFKNSNSFSVGMLKSHFKGAGLQFKEHQVYQIGDDVRFIDWKLSAKTNNTFIKTFEEERNIEIVVFIDFTESLLVGANNTSKLQAIIELTCLLYLLAEKSKDRVRTIISFESIQVLPPASGNEGLSLFISSLEKLSLINKEGRVNLQKRRDASVAEIKKYALLKSYVARNKEVVLFSDLSELTNIAELNKLTYKRNLHAFQVLSPIDIKGKAEFSISAFRKNKVVTAPARVGKLSSEIKGKLKKLDVSERYLEDFIHEML
tara:strand:- start:101568 stop:102398 length:831 start_codon:yes stop_codon:yes gene_type:complete